MSLQTQDDIAAALNRVADALFQQAKALKSQAKCAERSVEVSERLCKMQEANLGVTKELERRLAADTRSKHGPNA